MEKLITIAVIVGIVCLILGFLIAKSIEKKRISTAMKAAESRARAIIKEAEAEGENQKKDKILQAKEKFIELKAKHEKVIDERNRKISDAEKRVQKKESRLNQEISRNSKLNSSLEAKVKDYEERMAYIEGKKEEIDKVLGQKVKQLEVVSGINAEAAKAELVESLRESAKTDAMSIVRDTIEEAKMSAKQEARKIIINTIQRIGTEEAVDNCVSIFNLESDDIKGRIIGREGRNIRAIEAATGVEIIVDDTPEAVILSCFDSVRREVARLSLHKLVTDGRIHPARIENVVNKTRKEIDDEIIEIGKRTVIDLGIHGLHPELIKIVGRMKYRSSYGQNLLQHSRETAKLCSLMAAELGLNAKLAKRAGLLHDIGKVPETESEMPHALLGMEWAEKYGEKPEVCNAIGAHHDEIEMTSLLSPIVQVCDAISGARPGARRQAMDSYIQRLKDLENIAFGFKGVKKAYAIQAGRELRVMVDSSTVNDDESSKLSFEISQKIQTDMTYPGQVRVTVIREHRSVQIAR